MSEAIISVLVRKKQGTVFRGLAHRVTSWNEKGEFDIYPYHANFVSIISERLELESGDKIKQFSIKRGILFAKAGKVEIYLDI